MEIRSTPPFGSLDHSQPLRQDTPARGTSHPPPAQQVPPETSASPVRENVEEKTRRVAETIRERRDNGFYHRADVLREVVTRLLESRDLEAVAIRSD
jgi:hypothetical protein